MPMLERIAGNRELKQDLKTALGSGRIAHSILLVGEPGCGAGFAARCLAADYLYPDGGPHAEAVLRGQDTESIVVRGEGASGQIKVEAIRDARQNIQKSALSSDAEGRVLFIYGAQNLNGASANENYGGAAGGSHVPFDGFQCGGGAAHHPQPVCGLHHGTGADRRMCRCPAHSTTGVERTECTGSGFFV